MIDANRDNLIDHTEFISSLSRIYFGNFEEKAKFIFDMYDFDGNGQISREDIRTLLSYVPITTMSSAMREEEGMFTRGGGGSDTYYDRMKVQKQLLQLFNITLKEKPIINFEEFKNIVNKISSDMYLCVFIIVRDKLPNMKVFMQYKVDFKVDLSKLPATEMVSPKMTTLSPSSMIIKSSPYMKALIGKGKKPLTSNLLLKGFSLNVEETPEEIMLPNNDEASSEDSKEQISEKDTSVKEKLEFDDVKRLPNAIIIDNSQEDKKTDTKIDLMLSPTSFLSRKDKKVSMAICICGKLCEVKKDRCIDCLAQQCSKEVKSYLYIKKEGNKLKRYWCKLMGSNILCNLLSRL